MSNIPIRDLTRTGTPNASSQIVFDDGVMRRGTVGSMADAVRPVASQSEATAGADNTKVMTPLRVKQSIASEVGVSIASKSQGDLANTALQSSAIGTTIQPHDATLDSVAGLSTAANKLPYFTGIDTAALADLSAFGRSLIDDTDATAARATLGSVIGTDVQAYSGNLASLAAASGTNTMYYRSGPNTFSPVTIGANLTFGSGILAASGGGGGSGGYWINIKDPAYGAVGNGSTDDTAAINIAISACISAGGGTIYVPKGTYLITAATTTYSVPIRWLGEPGSTFKCVSASDVNFFTALGSVGTAKTLSFNSPRGFNYLPLNNVTGISIGSLILLGFTDANNYFHGVTQPVINFTASPPVSAVVGNALSVSSGSADITVSYTSHGRSVGDPVSIYSASAIGGNSPNGTYKVKSVINANSFTVAIRKGTFTSNVTNGGGPGTIVVLPSVHLAGQYPFDLSTAATTKSIQVMTPVNGGGFENIDFDGTGSTGNVTAVLAQYTAFQTYRNLRFKAFKSVVFDSTPGCGLLLNGGYANTLDNIYAEDCGSGGYNDISMYSQTRMSARALRSVRAFGFGPGLYFSSLCYIDDVTSDFAGERGFKLNGTLDSVVNSVDMSYAGFTGVAFAAASCRNIVSVIRARAASNASLWFSDQYNTDNYIGRVESSGTFDGNDVYIGPTDTNNIIASLQTAGVVTGVGKIGGKWVNYTPTLTPQSGSATLTTNYAAWQVQGDTLKIAISVTVTSAGTATGYLQVNVPSGLTIQNNGVGFGSQANILSSLNVVSNGSSSFIANTYNGASVFANGNILIFEASLRLA